MTSLEELQAKHNKRRKELKKRGKSWKKLFIPPSNSPTATSGKIIVGFHQPRPKCGKMKGQI